MRCGTQAVQPFADGVKRWTGCWVHFPTLLHHSTVNLVWARVGLIQPVTFSDVLCNLVVFNANVRSESKAENLPEQHPERPLVRVDCADAVIQSLGRHPPHQDGSRSTRSSPVIIFLGTNCSAEPKISKLAHHRTLLGQEHISGGEIAVKQLVVFQKRHCQRGLVSKRCQLGDCKHCCCC